MKNRKGISLIVLIITIIVVIILAAVVILTLSKNNPIESAKEARFKEDVRNFQDELALYISKQYANAGGHWDGSISATTHDDIVKYIPSFTKKYKGKFIINNNNLEFTNKLAEKEKEYSQNLNVNEKTKLLPDEYIQVEYIESTGTQFINTEVYPKSTTKVIFDFCFTDIDNSDGHRNGWGSAGDNEVFSMGINKGSYEFISRLGDNWNTQNSGLALDKKRHIFTLASGNQTIDGIKFGESTIGNTATDKQYMYLFAEHQEWENRNAIYSKRGRWIL